jgi:hypothetical protein
MRLAFLLSFLLFAPTAALAEPAPPPPLVMATAAAPALDALRGASLAQVAAPSPAAIPAAHPGLLDQALQFGLDHAGQGMLALLGILGTQTVLTAVRKRRIALATYHAFHMVEDLVDECEAENKSFPYLNKAKAGLAMLDEYMRTQGWRPAKPGEQAAAQLDFKSMNAQLNLKRELAAQAASVVLPTPAPSPAPATNTVAPGAAPSPL